MRPTTLGLRGRFAASVGDLVNRSSRLARRGSGTVAGGRVALALDPQLLAKTLTGRDVTIVSGTNGKTTTTALVVAALGADAVTNATGSNMIPGVVAAVTHGRGPVVLEVDERWVPHVLAAASDARSVVLGLLNLSRDQLDRSNEVRDTASRWRAALQDCRDNESVEVVADVSDPLIAFAVVQFPRLVAFAAPLSWRFDATSCPNCQRALRFDDDLTCPFEGEIVSATSWRCECDFVMPTPSAVVSESLHVSSGHYDIASQLPGSFNRRNVAVAALIAERKGVELRTALSRAGAVSHVAGRFAERTWCDRTWRLMLAKNPAGVDALLEPGAKFSDDVVVAINDGVADGRDPSWLYDAPFDRLVGHRVWCDGSRALDLQVRLHYADIDARMFDPQQLPREGTIDVIANYTAFHQWLGRTS